MRAYRGAGAPAPPQVAFAARKAGVPATMRDIAVSRLLSGSGAVPALFATQSVLDTTYTLTESPGGQTLDMVRCSGDGLWSAARRSGSTPAS